MIKVGFCVAYDWNLLNYSIPPIYSCADLICLSIDKKRCSWSGKPFTWDQVGFESMLKKIDPEGKVKLFEENFFLPRLTPMQNEVRQRNMMGEFMGNGGWHIQLDADEYFLDFEGFTKYLRNLSVPEKVNISCPWITLYKQLPNGFLWVKPESFNSIEFIQIATTDPYYEYGRRNGYFNILTDFPILHQSWARTKEEIWEKLNNWGHAQDFDVQKYYLLWQEAETHNYKKYQNFHHIKPEAWPKLDFARGRTIADMIVHSKEEFTLPINKVNLALSNSKFYSRVKKLIKTITRFK